MLLMAAAATAEDEITAGLEVVSALVIEGPRTRVVSRWMRLVQVRTTSLSTSEDMVAERWYWCRRADMT